jgi:DNA-binding CsgD family transcriptional regulator
VSRRRTSSELTDREREVFALLLEGLPNNEIAKRLFISTRTVETHVRTLLRKTGASRRSELISASLRESRETPSGRHGTLWLTEPERNTRWSARLEALLEAGDPEGAFRLLIDLADLEHSWDLVLDLLRVGEMTGLPTETLRHVLRLEDELADHPPGAEAARALAYYRGRLLSQLGLIHMALAVHQTNLPAGSIVFGGPYQRRSRFAIATLHFAVEDFGRAQDELDLLHQALSDVLDPDPRYVVDVYQYRGTLAVVSLLHDLPFSPAQAIPADVDVARHFGAQALAISEEHRYPEGIVWGHAVLAFASEAAGDFERAAREYDTARRAVLALLARWSVKVHLLLYHAGYQRRCGEFAAAEQTLDLAMALLPPDPQVRLRARVLEERSHLLRQRDAERSAGLDELDAAMRLYAGEPGLVLFSDWPIVRRLRRTCRQRGLDFSGYLLPGGPEGRPPQRVHHGA